MRARNLALALFTVASSVKETLAWGAAGEHHRACVKYHLNSNLHRPRNRRDDCANPPPPYRSRSALRHPARLRELPPRPCGDVGGQGPLLHALVGDAALRGRTWRPPVAAVRVRRQRMGEPDHERAQRDQEHDDVAPGGSRGRGGGAEVPDPLCGRLAPTAAPDGARQGRQRRQGEV